MPHQRFRLRSIEDLEKEIEGLGVDLPLEKDLSVLADPLEIGGRTAPNRLAVQPMEGFDADESGTPGDLTFRHPILGVASTEPLTIWVATSTGPVGRSRPYSTSIASG